MFSHLYYTTLQVSHCCDNSVVTIGGFFFYLEVVSSFYLAPDLREKASLESWVVAAGFCDFVALFETVMGWWACGVFMTDLKWLQVLVG